MMEQAIGCVRVLRALIVALCLMNVVGCASQGITRELNYTHWHDEETMIVVYHRDLNKGVLSAFWRPSPLTTHVLICRIQPENHLICREQRLVANMLNPHAVDFVDLADSWHP